MTDKEKDQRLIQKHINVLFKDCNMEVLQGTDNFSKNKNYWRINFNEKFRLKWNNKMKSEEMCDKYRIETLSCELNKNA